MLSSGTTATFSEAMMTSLQNTLVLLLLVVVVVVVTTTESQTLVVSDQTLMITRLEELQKMLHRRLNFASQKL
jgi:hypothetical protein